MFRKQSSIIVNTQIFNFPSGTVITWHFCLFVVFLLFSFTEFKQYTTYEALFSFENEEISHKENVGKSNTTHKSVTTSYARFLCYKSFYIVLYSDADSKYFSNNVNILPRHFRRPRGRQTPTRCTLQFHSKDRTLLINEHALAFFPAAPRRRSV